MMIRRSVSIVGAAALAAVILAGPALAAWSTGGTATAQATSTSVGTVTDVVKKASTTTSVTIGWAGTAAAAAGAPVTYVVTRTPGTTPVTCAAPAVVNECTETGFTASTAPASFTYTVTPTLHNWSGTAGIATNVGPSASTPSGGTTLTVDTFVATGSGQAVRATGTGAFGTAGDSTTVTVVFCKSGTFPCTNGANTQVVPVNQTTGAWTATSGNMGNGSSVWVRAEQTRSAGNLTSNIRGPVTA